MKKMRKFAWIFMAAMTVAGFSACSNSEEDEPLPGLGGGSTPGGSTTSEVVLTDTIYQFNNIEADYTSIEELCPGWKHEIISPVDDDRTWQSKTFTNKTTNVTEKYLQATAHDGTDSNAGKTYDWWMITPALNVKDAAQKVFSFYSEIAYWKDDTKLEVYVLSEQSSTAQIKKLDPVLANNTNPGGNFQGWIASGDIDLSGYGDVVYIGFHYVAKGGKSQSTTYCIDDFAFGRKQVEHFMGENGGGEEPSEPGTSDVDWTEAITVAEALQLDNAAKTMISVKGYIIGCLKSGAASQIADASAAYSEAEIGLDSYSGSTTAIIADSADETDLTKCLWVKLNDQVSKYPGAEGLRNAVALDDHPENVGKMLYAKGKKMAMFSGLPGVRDIEGWKLGE